MSESGSFAVHLACHPGVVTECGSDAEAIASVTVPWISNQKKFFVLMLFFDIWLCSSFSHKKNKEKVKFDWK